MKKLFDGSIPQIATCVVYTDSRAACLAVAARSRAVVVRPVRRHDASRFAENRGWIASCNRACRMNDRLAASFVALVLGGCTLDEHAVDAVLRDPSRVAVQTRDGRTVLEAGRAPTTATVGKLTASRERDGAIVINGRTTVDRHGAVSALDALEDVSTEDGLRLPVCMRYHRGGCRGVLVTPMDNVKVLREYLEPVRVVGLVELALAGLAIGWGVSLAETSQTTSGGGLLIGSGTILAIIGAVQTFRPRHHVNAIVER